MKVLVTDGTTRSALAAVRSLGRAGHAVIVASDFAPSLAGVSRYASTTVTSPNPLKSPAQYVEYILLLCREHLIEVVLPMTDVSTLLLASNRQRLPNGCRLPVAPNDALNVAGNKAEVVRLAATLSVPVPRTTLVHHADEIEKAIEGLDYPIVIKPARSRVLTGNGWLATRVSYATHDASLRRQLSELPPHAFPALLQERIVGPGVGIFVCFREGDPIALFSHRRLREKPPSGGVSVLCESIPLDPTAAGHAIRLLRSIGWDGVAMVEFKRDNRDGSLRLMEINGRFWGSLQLAIDAGVDFPRLLIDTAPRSPTANPSYETGVRTRWFWGDVDSLAAVLFTSSTELALPENHPGRLRTLLAFLDFCRAKQRSETLRIEDPLPGLLETWNWIRGNR